MKIENKYEQDVVSGFSSASAWIGKQILFFFFSVGSKEGGKAFLSICVLVTTFLNND